MRTCTKCGKNDSNVKFYKGSSKCTECQRQFMKSYRSSDRLAALKAYGGENPKCACPNCNESHIHFLTIDHIECDGRKHRKELAKGKEYPPGGGVFYRWLKTNNYPVGFRVLCYNCNNARNQGPCPVHEMGINEQ